MDEIEIALERRTGLDQSFLRWVIKYLIVTIILVLISEMFYSMHPFRVLCSSDHWVALYYVTSIPEFRSSANFSKALGRVWIT